MQVHGVAVLPSGSAPVLLLRETEGARRWLAITIGEPEAAALIDAQEQVEHPRPTTVELIRQVIVALGRGLVRVEVTELRDGIFLSDLVFDGDSRVSARPSDAVAIGVRAGVPVSVAEEVLAEAAVEIEVNEVNADSDTDAGPLGEVDIDDFRAQLDELTADDFRDDPPGR